MSRASHLKSRYGITEAQYEELFSKQEGKCFICQRHQSEFSTRLCVDHNHKEKFVRGLLCSYCNHRLLGRHTDPELLERMALYLRTCKTDWLVPDKKRKRKRKIG